MEQFSAYGHALFSVVIWIVVVQLLSAWVGAAKAKAGVVPGATPEADYSNKVYRIHRAYENSIANLAVLTSSVVVAALAGASPFWVNLLASVAVLARIVMIYVHIQAIGKPTKGIRTAIFVFHWALILIIALMAAFSVI